LLFFYIFECSKILSPRNFPFKMVTLIFSSIF